MYDCRPISSRKVKTTEKEKNAVKVIDFVVNPTVVGGKDAKQHLLWV